MHVATLCSMLEGKMLPHNSPLINDFAKFIADRTTNFTGREWVLTEIDRWLTEPAGPSFFIITGEPGVGKSAIAARLTQVRDLAAYHFCIARQADTINPALFARSLSHQLCRIDGFALGILKDSNLDLKTTQNVQANYGQIIGAKIENLVINAPSGADAFTHAVTQPLKALYAEGYEQQIVILVDALDEAVQHKGSETIVDLLANAGDLPHQVRFVLTSRPEGAALRHFEERQIPHFRLDAGRPENLEDIRRYVRGQLAASEALRDRVADQHMDEAAFVERVTTASQGNFLYIVWLLPAIAAGTQRFDALEALPQGLDGIYREFLRTRIRIDREDKQNWRILYRPILGSLVAAFAPLTAKQIEQFTDLSSQDVADTLQDLGQFLDPTSADEDRYFLYHQSVNDWLQNRERSQEFWVDVTPVHQRIVRSYRKDAASWGEIHWERAEEVDEYGFSHVTGHLFALRADPIYCRQLYEFVCRPVMVAKRQRTGADRAFAADVELVLKAAAEPKLRNWVQMGRASLLYAMLGSLATNVAPAMLGALAACGQVERALAYAELVQDSQQRFDSYLCIGMAAVAQPELGRAAAILEKALHAAEAIYDYEAKSEALSQVAQALVQAGQPERALAAAEAFQDRRIGLHMLSHVVQALAQARQTDWLTYIFEREQHEAKDIYERVERDKAIQEGLASSKVIQMAPAPGTSGSRVLRGGASSNVVIQMAQGFVQTEQIMQVADILKQTLTSAQLIRSQQEQAEAFRQVADGLIQIAQAGLAHRSLEIVEQYLTSIDGLKETQARNLADKATVSALARAGRCAWLQLIGEGADNLYVRVLAQTAAASCLQQRGQADPALETITTAAVAMHSITGKQDRVSALTQAARLLGQLGAPEQAGQIMDLAIATARQFKLSHQQAIAASQIARVLAALARPDDANGFATIAHNTARSVKQPATAIDCLDQAAIALYAVGRRDDALNEVEYALGLAKRLTDIDQAHAWSELTRSLVTLGENARAAALIKDAWSKLTSNGSQPNTAIVQAHVAHSLDLVGLHDEALAAFQSALLQARYAGRDSVLEVLAEGVPVLAALDNGDTVWQLYQAIQEIDSWWRAPQAVRA